MPYVRTMSLADDIAKGIISECYLSCDIYLKSAKDTRRAPFITSGFVFNKNTTIILKKLHEKGHAFIPVTFYKKSLEEAMAMQKIENSVMLHEALKNSLVSHFSAIKKNVVDDGAFGTSALMILDRVIENVIKELISNPNIELCLYGLRDFEDLEGHSSRVCFIAGCTFFKLLDYFIYKERILRKGSRLQIKDMLQILIKSAIFHDIGKLQLDKSLLNRRTRLSPEDIQQVREKLPDNFGSAAIVNLIEKISNQNFILPEEKERIDVFQHNNPVLTEEQYRRLTIAKMGNLLPEEMQIVEKHTINGWVMMTHWEMAVPRTVALLHHKHYNGGGYPQKHLTGLETPSGDKIHTFARIMAIADVYDALTSDRPYRAGHHALHSLNIMKEMTENGNFDPEIFSFFVEMIKPFQVGDEVELSDGRRAMVFNYNKGARLRPQLICLFDENGKKIPEEKLNYSRINLMDGKNNKIYIAKHNGKIVSKFTENGQKDFGYNK